MKFEDGKITFASGNVLDMHGTDGFSLSVSDGDDELSIGYDQYIWYPGCGDVVGGSYFTATDRAEIADHMIARWQQWKTECAK